MTAAQADGRQADGRQADDRQADGRQADRRQADGRQADNRQADGRQADNRQADGRPAGEARDGPGHALRAPQYFTRLDGKRLRCDLCPRGCVLEPGAMGACRVRGCRDGAPDLPLRGFVTAAAMDPIEKKPLAYYRPGSMVFSVGFAGCNLRCPFCQNAGISQAGGHPPSGRRVTPGELVAAARSAGSAQIAYTYSEPLVHIEFLLDCMTAARRAGLANILVSNGCVTEAPAREVLALTDAANIDLKCFSPATYAKVLGGDLPTVLAFLRLAVELGTHLEVTTLVVPGLNDGDAELRGCRDFLAGLGDVPWHLTAYHPAWHWNAPPTPPALLHAAAAMARERLPRVRLGNVRGA